MCRHFLDRPLAPGLVDRLLDLAVRAPSAGHTQGWSWLVLEAQEERDRFWAATAEPALVPEGVRPAPVIVVPLCSRAAYETRYRRADKARFAWDVPYWTVDTSMATMLLLLGAHDAGLGALLMRLHRPAAHLREAFGIPQEWEPLGAVALGHPDRSLPARPPRPRLPRSEVVHRGVW